MGTVTLGEAYVNHYAVYCPDSASAGDGRKQNSHTWCRQENVHQILCHLFILWTGHPWSLPLENGSRGAGEDQLARCGGTYL